MRVKEELVTIQETESHFKQETDESDSDESKLYVLSVIL